MCAVKQVIYCFFLHGKVSQIFMLFSCTYAVYV